MTSLRRNVTRRSRLRRACSLVLKATLIGASTAHAAVTNEIWPEIDIGFPISGPVRMLFTDSGTRDADSGDKSQGAYGAYVDYRICENVSVRVGYKYLQNLKLSSGARENVEHRQTFDFNYLSHLGRWDIQLADRTRIEVRDQGGTTTYRFRNRVTLSRALQARDVRFTPYASGEVYYDTQYGRVDRLQFRLGATLPTGPIVAWDFYLARQRDTQIATKFVNALGITLTVKY